MRSKQTLAAFLGGYVCSPSLVCSVEGDDPNGDGGAPAAATPPAPATPAQPTFTPEQLAFIEGEKAKAANAAAAAARRAAEGKQKPGGDPPPTATTAPTPPIPDVSSEYARHRAFDRAIGKFELTEKALELTEREFLAAKPPDPIAWLNERAEAYGWKRPGEASTPPGTGQPPSAAPAPNPTGAAMPVTSRAAPPSATAPTEDTPILSMSVADREALRAKIGDVAFAERHMRELATRNVRIRPRLV